MALPAYEKLGSFYLGRTYDAATSADTRDPLLYDSRDLTTHAVCVGMTGSGKTGLCLALLEEAAIDGIPAIVIDPKGDLGNLKLTFPNLTPGDFRPWVDPGEAARKGLDPDAYAASTSEIWKKGLADWEQDGDRIQRFRDAVDVEIYTPGSNAGTPLSVLRSFDAPPPELRDDTTALRDRISAAVSGLLGLLGIDADPLRSREHILLATIFDQAWRAGTSLDIAALIQSIQKPSFTKVGVFDLESFFPAKERLGLAMSINNLLAAPGFATWMEGEPMDVQRLLYTPAGKPRVAIVSIAHLNDAERMFVVTLLLNEVVAWMRRQSGTSSLRALLYMDEIFGYFPPSAMPPSKIPLLTLMKQARAFGLGVVLSTQNPVDLDYKGLSNAGTWFIGRLQTERDKARVIDGLLSGGDGSLDKAELEPLIANLGNRVFLMRNVHDDAPVLFRTRWALSYLKGPMTLQEIGRLKPVASASAQSAGASPSSATSATRAAPAAAQKPMIPAGVTEYHLAGAAGGTWRPHVVATVRTHFVDAKWGLDTWETQTYLAPLLDDESGPDWTQSTVSADLKDRLQTTGPAGAAYAEAPASVLRPQNYAAWSKQLGEYVYQTAKLDVFSCPLLKMTSAPGGSEGDFRAHIALALREKRDAEIEKLRKKYAPRLTALTEQVRRNEERVEREKSQVTDQTMQTAISIGTTLLGALLGRKALSSTNIGRAGTAVRSAGRVAREKADVGRAQEGVEAKSQQLTDLQSELELEIGKLQGELDPSVIDVETISVKVRKSDTSVTPAALVWVAG
ncbi:MAG: DUF87 domain-containing protein [Steroidobacteraceae bacterium]